MKARLYVVTLAAMFAATSTQAIQLGLLDDFEGGPMMCTTDDWFEPGASPNPPTAELLCGELETCCLSAVSAGGFGPGSRQVVLNEDQWVGDYVAAGVNKIQLLAAASGVSDINLRVGVTNGQTCYVSTDALLLPSATPGPDGLVFGSFLLDESSMTEVLGNNCGIGGDSLETVLTGVIQLRLLSSETPSWLGDAIDSVMQIDAIQSKGDSDLDGVNDDVDNCTAAANTDQVDSDGDGFGNACDTDLNNDCVVNVIDLGLLRSVFFTADANADFNGDGVVNVIDLGILRTQFFGEPGPGLGACGACVAPDALGTNTDFGGLPMFMRGGLVNDWGADPAINGFSDQTGGLYVARFEANAGTFEWKVADEGWSIEYCSETDTLTENTPLNAPLFGCAFPANGMVEIPASGCYEFQMQTDGTVPAAEVDITFTPVN